MSGRHQCSHRVSPAQTKTLFCLQELLHRNRKLSTSIPTRMPKSPTFHNFNGKSTSTIHLFMHSTTDDSTVSIHIDDELPPTPAHTILLQQYYKQHYQTSILQMSHQKKTCIKVRWDKIDKVTYRELTRRQAQGTTQSYIAYAWHTCCRSCQHYPDRKCLCRLPTSPQKEKRNNI